MEVTILVPGPHADKRVSQIAGQDSYMDLLEAGVKLFEYLPTLIHHKIVVYDSAFVTIGSANLNQRSRFQDHEVQLVVDDRDFAAEIDSMLDEDVARSRALGPGQWRRRGVLQRAGELLMRPFRRQM